MSMWVVTFAVCEPLAVGKLHMQVCGSAARVFILLLDGASAEITRMALKGGQT